MFLLARPCMPMLIRPFEPADADTLADLFHASVRQVGIRHYSPEQVAAWSPARPDPARYVDRTRGRTVLVAVDEHGAVAGYGDLEPDGHIDHLYCRPDRVGTGVGSTLYAGLEAAADQAGMPALFVEASEGARGFFARQGFRLDGRDDFVLNGVALHNYRMLKRLA